MASKAEHQAKWLHNRAFLPTIGDEYPDWIATVMFYAALHAVETLFAHDNTRVHGGHRPRNSTLKKFNRYQNIWRHYRPLYDAGRIARYETNAVDMLPVENVKGDLHRHFDALEKGVLRLMRSNDTLDPIWPA